MSLKTEVSSILQNYIDVRKVNLTIPVDGTRAIATQPHDPSCPCVVSASRKGAIVVNVDYCFV